MDDNNHIETQVLILVDDEEPETGVDTLTRTAPEWCAYCPAGGDHLAE